MVAPSILFVFDVSALIPGKTRDWQELAQLGQVYLPQAVVEEMQFLCDRATEPEIETVAREFARFFPNSGWQVTEASASHPSLQPDSGQTLSKKARRSLAVAQATYGLYQEQPQALVVLIANDQPLLKKVQSLGAPTLGGLTTAVLRQWCRTVQSPASIAPQFRAAAQAAGTGGMAAARPRPTPRPPTSAGPGSATSARSSKTKSHQRRSGHPKFLSQLISGLIALIFFVGGGLLLWRFIHAPSFNQVWQQLGLSEKK